MSESLDAFIQDLDEEADVVKRQRLESTLSEIQAFLGSRVHSLFLSQTQFQLTQVIEIILDRNTTNHAEIMELKGQKIILSDNLSLFEDAAQTLKDRIEKLLELENQTEQNE